MTNITNDLIYEVLKDVQHRITNVEQSTKDNRVGIANIRKDIHRVEGHILRQDDALLNVDERLTRIERRLQLADA